jgi:Leucine-rich repeat (LRR) protein
MIKPFTTIIFAAACSMMLSSCDRYRVTLNDRAISEPRPVITDVDVEDAQLKTCLLQVAEDISLRDVRDLKQLNCSHGAITSVKGLEQFSRLQVLNLEGNDLTDIEPLFYLGELSALNLKDNKHLNCTQLEKVKNQLPSNATLISPSQCD